LSVVFLPVGICYLSILLSTIFFIKTYYSSYYYHQCEGLPNLSKIVLEASGRIAVVAAAGLNADNADIIISGSGVRGVHAGSSVMSLACHENNSSNSNTGDLLSTDIESHNLQNISTTAIMGTNSNATDDMKWESVDEAKVVRYVNSANEGFATYQRNCFLLPAPILPVDTETDIDVYPTYS
jgi:hypothetical protein